MEYMPYPCQGEQVVHWSGLRVLDLLWIILVILLDSNLDTFLVTLNDMQFYRFLHFFSSFSLAASGDFKATGVETNIVCLCKKYLNILWHC